MTWFESVFGFRESEHAVRRELRVEGARLVRASTGQSWAIGTLGTPSLKELRVMARSRPGRPRLRELVANVVDLHANAQNAHAVFQVASQFNLLEMPSPEVTPSAGVTGYIHDRTQGPACALAAPAATVFRNWFAPTGTSTGQTSGSQLDMLEGVGRLLGNTGDLWSMRNGYAMFDPDRSAHLERALAGVEPNTLRGALRVGVHQSVGLSMASHTVTQVFGSALPLAYMERPGAVVRQLARQVLRASYEATLRVAAAEAERTGQERVFLTLLGGGVFGNDVRWIVDAIAQALEVPGLGSLDVVVVSYGRSRPEVKALARTR